MKQHRIILMTVLAVMVIGCDENQRIADLAEQELERRAAETQQLGEMHEKVQQERIELGHGRAQLEEDRRQLATQRHRDPLIATAITSTIWLFVCILPLFLCWRLLQTPTEDEIEETMQEVLIQDLVAEQPLLLPKDQPALPLDTIRESIGDS